MALSTTGNVNAPFTCGKYSALSSKSLTEVSWLSIFSTSRILNVLTKQNYRESMNAGSAFGNLPKV